MEPGKSPSYLFVILCLALSVFSFTIAGGQVNVLFITHNSPSQNEIVVHLDNIVDNAPDATGWTVEYNSMAQSIFPVIGGLGTDSLVLTVANPVLFGDVVTVTYNQATGSVSGPAGPLVSFSNVPSQNTNMPSCNMFTGVKTLTIDSLSGQCSPVVIDISLQYEIYPHIRNSINFNDADLRFEVHWGDGGNTVDQIPVTETFPGSGIFVAATSFVYSPDGNCSKEIIIFPIYAGGSPFQCPGGPQEMHQLVASYGSDNEGSGSLILSPDGPLEYCIGEDIDMTFSDMTDFNCDPTDEPVLPNTGERHVRLIYGTVNTPGRMIPNVYVNGTQVTDATGNLISTPYEGPVEYYDSADTPFPNAVSFPITHTGDSMNDLPGDFFEVTMEYWGPCNPYDGGFGTPITMYEVITLNDLPPPPNASDQSYCSGSVGNLTATDNTGGTLNWYDDAGLTNLLANGPVFNHGQNTPGIYDYWVTEVSGSGCEGPARHVQLRIDHPPEIVVQPVDRAVCEGADAMFVVDAGLTTNPIYQWEEYNGGSWNPVVGGPYVGQTTDTFRIIGVTSIFNDYQYRVIVSGTCAPSVTSAPAVITVLETPEITVQPVDYTECEGVPVSYTVDPGVTTNPDFSWEYNDGGGWAPVPAAAPFSGYHTNTLVIDPTPLNFNGYEFQVTVNNTCNIPQSSDSVLLTVYSAPVITMQPADTGICESTFASFHVTSPDAVAYQWQVSDDDGNTWMNVVDGPNYSGSTINTLALSAIPLSFSGNRYRMEAINADGCQRMTDVAILTVDNVPSITLQPLDAVVCEGHETMFIIDAGVTTTPDIRWEYHDGSGWKDVTETPPFYGSHDDSLIIKDAPLTINGYQFRAFLSNGCSVDSSNQVNLTVDEMAFLIREPDHIMTDEPGIIQFVAESGGPVHTKVWQRSADGGSTWPDLSDGTKYSGTASDTLTLINPSPSDNIWFRLKLITPLGCETYSNSAQIGIDFHYQVDETTVYLTGMAPQYQYQWSFGDGEFSNVISPSYTYPAPGLYEVCLTAFDDNTDFSEVVCKPILVGTVDCQALFEYTISGTDSLTVNATDASTGAVNSWYWTFGDGFVSEKKDPVHKYSFPGLYKVCLTTLDTITGCQSHICREIKVGREPMIADYIHFTNDTNMTVVFSSQSTGDITHWYWTFGDGESFIGKDTSHTYDRPGVYEVCLFTNNSVTGDFAESCKKIRVGETLCNVKAGFSTFISNKNLRVAFNDRSTGNIKSWFWNFGDGISSTLRNPVHIYEKNGLYRVSLSVRDSLGKCYDFFSELIRVGDIACIADFEYSVDPATKTVAFKNRSSRNSELSYWSFGDGEYGDERDPEHTYPDFGVFGVTLTIVDSTGQCMDSRFEKVQIGSVDCQADFTWFVDSAGNKAFFTSHLLGDPTQVVWTFGDGSSSNRINPVHQYAAGGFYKVSLTAFNDMNGCMDYQEKIILISTRGEDCLADFIYSSDRTTREVSFTEKSTGNINTYIWDFGDRTVVEAKNPVYTYDKGGFYLVCLTVLNEFGITNTTCKYIQVAAESSKNCLADYYFSIDSASRTVSFVDASFGQPDEWTWDFGDDDTSHLEEPVHVYSESGIYRVGLRIRNSSTGCVSKVFKLVDAGAGNTGLYASFVYELDSTNVKAESYPVDFIGTSLGDSKKLKWDFGDGETDSTSIMTRHEYTTQDIFNVCYTVSNPITGEMSKSCDQVSTISSGRNGVRSSAYSLVAYPNPFNDKLVIDYYLPAEEYVDISVYDFTGRKIATVVGMSKIPGNHTVEFDQAKLPAGLYYVVMQTKRDYLVNKVIKQ